MQVRAAKLRMPSWENVEEAINFTVQPRKDAHPELFAASKEAKSMPGDERGRQSVQHITHLQFPREREQDIQKLNRALKNLTDDVSAAASMPMPKFPFVELPPPPPTDLQLYNRRRREQCDVIGHLKPAALHSTVWDEQSLSDLITTSVVNVKNRGGVLQYPSTQRANTRYDPYSGQWCEDAVREIAEEDLFANSVFRARSLSDRRSLQQRPPHADVHRRQIMNSDGTWGGQWEDIVPREQYLEQRDWRYPRDYHSMGVRDKDKTFDINEFLAGSVFCNDKRAEHERKAKDDMGERHVRELEQMRIAHEEAKKMIEEHEKLEMRARHQDFLAQQQELELRNLHQDEVRKEQRETDRIAALRLQKAEEAVAAAQRREETLQREQEEESRQLQESQDAQHRHAEKLRRREEEERSTEDFNRQRRLMNEAQTAADRMELQREHLEARQRAEQQRIVDAAKRKEEEQLREGRIATNEAARKQQQMLDRQVCNIYICMHINKYLHIYVYIYMCV